MLGFEDSARPTLTGSQINAEPEAATGVAPRDEPCIHLPCRSEFIPTIVRCGVETRLDARLHGHDED